MQHRLLVLDNMLLTLAAAGHRQLVRQDLSRQACVAPVSLLLRC